MRMANACGSTGTGSRTSLWWPHFCQGTHVARRAVAHVMLPMLFDRFPDMTIPNLEDVIWRGFGFRGPTQIPVKLQ